ncbi:MAG TPA: DUF3108 domain-containing protein [Burkholderiaceae bacterium]|nr:DUF3108 domain-containing protein [Burkholderiaceae bacterium]
MSGARGLALAAVALVLSASAAAQPVATDPGASQPAPAASAASASADAASTPVPAPATPVYRTRVQPASKAIYNLHRGGIAGIGELDWRPEGKRYTLTLTGKVPVFGTLITQTSQGAIDTTGLVPARYADRRLRRAEDIADFRRSADGKTGVASFSGPPITYAIRPGTQDRLSVMVQLGAIAAGWQRAPAAGSHFDVYVIGSRGEADVWSFRYEGLQPVSAAGASVSAHKFLREPGSPRETRAEFWLDPARNFMPVRALLTEANGEVMELLRSQQQP